MPSSKVTTLDMTYIAMFAILMAVCSWIAIPSPVPFSLQTFGLFLTMGVLGGKRGTLAVLIYLLLGAVGLPVFTGFRGGLGAFLGSTGGYIIGFLFSALFQWGVEILWCKKTQRKIPPWGQIVSMAVGLFICYAFGTVWFMAIYAGSIGEIGVWTALSWCVFPFIIPDCIKMGLALVVCRKLARVIKAA